MIPYARPPKEAPEEGAEHIHVGFLVPDAAVAYERLRATGARFLGSDVKARAEPSGPPPEGVRG